MNNRYIDINCDLGERSDPAGLTEDLALMNYISSCNIACGFHAGDEATMQQMVKAAMNADVAIGAHPSYPDRVNFGRKDMQMDTPTFMAAVCFQIEKLKSIAEQEGAQLRHVKAHGALYNRIAWDIDLAEIFVQAVFEIDNKLVLYVPAASAFEEWCKANDIRYLAEAFADRRYLPDGRLAPRTQEGSVISEETALLAQLNEIINNQQVISISGEAIPIVAQTICLHSDSAQSLHLARAILGFLKEHHIGLKAGL